MMLGKRTRPPMKRTTSMTEFTLQQDLINADQSDPFTGAPRPPPPRLNRRNSMDSSSQAAPFLRVCSLCKRRLIPGRDIYMYRGDTAFCSLECRQRKISQDESMDKCASSSTVSAGTAAA